MLYHIRDLVNAHALVTLYYSFVYSRLSYGITAWGTAAQNQLYEIEFKLNNIIRTMTWNKNFSHVSQLYKKLGFLKLHDVNKLELSKFMNKLFKNKLPKLCSLIIDRFSHDITMPIVWFLLQIVVKFAHFNQW